MRSKAFMDIMCPVCNCRGQLKVDRGKFYRVDHYRFKNGFRHGKWERSCYVPLQVAEQARLPELVEHKEATRGPLVIGKG